MIGFYKQVLIALVLLGGTGLINSTTVAQNPDSIDYLDNLDYWTQQCYNLRGRQGLEACDRAIEIQQDNPIFWTTRGAILHRDLNKSSEALTYHNHALKIDRDNSLAWYNRCTTLNNLRRYEEAVTSCEYSLLGDGNWGDGEPYLAWIAKGVGLRRWGRYDQAVEAYDEAIALKPDDLTAWNNKGVALYKAGRYLESLDAFEMALEIDVDDQVAQQNRDLALQRLGKL